MHRGRRSLRSPAGAPAFVGLLLVLLVASSWSPRAAVAQAGTTIRLEQRGGVGELTGTLVTMDDRGVRLESERLGERLVTWDRIRRVRGADHPRLEAWLADGTTIWRARIRIGRGDPLSAEPLLESLASRFDGRTDELALIVAEGLLRCRIARGAHDRAIVPMLETIRLRAAGVSSRAYASLPPVIDAETGLAPQVPPAWHAGADRTTLEDRLQRIRRDFESQAASEPFSEVQRAAAARTARIATCYLAAVQIERGRAGVALPAPDGDAGLRVLVRCIGGPEALAAFDPPPPPDDAPIDPASILEEADPRDDRPAWIRDWTGYFDGRRALASSDPAVRDRGLVQLLRPPALHAVQRPYLAGIALARAAAFLDRVGRADEAAILRADLAARFRGHPDVPAGAAGDPESSAP